MSTPQTALITGASSGIGRALAKVHAKHGGNLVITARREDALEALRAEILSDHPQITVTTLAQDLGGPEQAESLAAALSGQPIDILINNAGFGGHGPFVERPLADDLAMIDLNVKALVALCHHFGSQMAERGRGKILNVSSSAAYMPGPLQATYFATKAFVSSFSQALDDELRPKGVTVTALEPGYVETEFTERANLAGTPLTKKGASAQSVAAFGYKAMQEGRLRAVNERQLSFAVNWLFPLLPRRTVLKQVRKLQTKS